MSAGRHISEDRLIGILVKHKKWLSSRQTAGARGDLSHMCLKSLDLPGVELQKANLKDVDLEGANLKGAKLQSANLEGAKLRGANLELSDLEMGNLERADLVGARLSKAGLAWVNLRNAALEGACFSGAELVAANLEEARCENADFSGARLTMSNFKRANASGSDLSKAQLRSSNMKGGLFQGARLHGANVKGADMRGADFRHADVSDIQYNRRGRYRGMAIEGCYGSPRFVSFAQRQGFIEGFRSSWWRFPLYIPWLLLVDCGRSWLLWSAWAIGFPVLFGLKFFVLGPDAFALLDRPWTIGSMIYTSTVNFFTLGFVHLRPYTENASWWIMAETVVAYAMLLALLSIPVVRMKRP